MNEEKMEISVQHLENNQSSLINIAFTRGKDSLVISMDFSNFRRADANGSVQYPVMDMEGNVPSKYSSTFIEEQLRIFFLGKSSS